MDAAVLGAGSWGTALALLLARNGFEVGLYGRDPEEIEIMRARRENLRYLPGFALPKEVSFNLMELADSAPMTVVAVPSNAVREVLTNLHGDHPLIVIASKGVELSTCQLLADVVKEVRPNSKIAVLSGPNLAVEIVRGIPTAALAACDDDAAADRVRSAFMCASYRVYATRDVVGVEIAGALKNVLALGGGMSDGLGFGDNTKGALLARGLKEMVQFGMAKGGRLETFLGIAGVGDLFATASSHLSRNYRVGRALGEGRHITEILSELGQVAEGVATAEAVLRMARPLNVPMPIFETIENVIRERVGARHAVSILMERMTREEGYEFLNG